MHDDDDDREWTPDIVWGTPLDEERAREAWLLSHADANPPWVDPTDAPPGPLAAVPTSELEAILSRSRRPPCTAPPWVEPNAAPQRPVDAPSMREAPTTQASAPAAVQPSPAPAPVPDPGDEQNPAQPWLRLCALCTIATGRRSCSRCSSLVKSGACIGPAVDIPHAIYRRECAHCHVTPLRAEDVRLCERHRASVYARTSRGLDSFDHAPAEPMALPGRYPGMFVI
jgi:hypothetical protein